MEYTSQQQEAAKWVLIEALQTPTRASVLILYDEHTADTAQCLAQISRSMSLTTKTIKVPIAEQVEYRSDPKKRLPDPICEAIDRSPRIILLQKREPETNRYRLVVLARIDRAGAPRRTASMPGITLDLLPFCTGDLDELEDSCRLLAHRLLWAGTAYLTTWSRNGKEHTLTIPLGQFLPILSPGRIYKGWGNVPSGETFVVPNAGCGLGSVVINGSAPGHVFAESEEMTLGLQDGRVVPPLGGNAPEKVQRLIFDSQGKETVSNCSILSELGIGLNPHIGELTGIPVVDEKMLNTIHIALGSSKQFDGPTTCDVHNDYVIRHGDLRLDHTYVVRKGKYCLTEGDVFPHWRDVERTYLAPGQKLTLTGKGLADVVSAGKVLAVREWTTKRARFMERMQTRIGEEETSALAYRLLAAIEESPGRRATLRQLQSACVDSVPRASVAPILELLVRFQMVEHV